jgi:hypothetical protein
MLSLCHLLSSFLSTRAVGHWGGAPGDPSDFAY